MTDSYLGIDVSRHNGAIDYQRSAAAGVKFAAIRCTVGDYYSDPRFSEHWQGFRDAGILVSAYHVVAPANSSNKPISAEAQMDRFLAALESRLPDYPLILDCELACGRDKQAVSAIILGCCRRLLGSSGYAYPLIYTRKTWWDAHVSPNPAWKLHPLWVAHYTTALQPWLPRDWEAYQVWQYTNRGSGVQFGAEETYIDLNRARTGLFEQSAPAHPPEVSACIQVTIDEQLYTGEAILKPHAKALRGKERKE